MTWKNKIVGHADVDPRELVAQDRNWRSHPASQAEALSAAIGDLGFLRSVTVNLNTSRIVDGHLRVALAIRDGEATISVEYVDLTEAEEALALATLDPLAALAEADAKKVDALLREVQTGSESLANLLTGLAEQSGVVPKAEGSAGAPSASGGKGKTLTLHYSDEDLDALLAFTGQSSEAKFNRKKAGETIMEKIREAYAA